MAFADPFQALGFDACPDCGAPLVLRLAGGDGRPRRRFWGCSTYPVSGCGGVRDFEGSTVERSSAWPRTVRRRDRGIERSMSRVALVAVVTREDQQAAAMALAAPRRITDSPSARAAARRRAATARVGREYHRRVDARVAMVGERWPLMLMAYVGFAGGAVMATAWIHPAFAGVALMTTTALYVEALLRPPTADAPDRERSVHDEPEMPRPDRSS